MRNSTFQLAVIFVFLSAHSSVAHHVSDIDGETLISNLKQQGRLPDFSYVGYEAGEKEIPLLPVAIDLKKDYGAVGDGKADDTDALLKAINDIQSGAIYLPAGHYRITKRILLNKKDVVIRGEAPQKTFLEFPSLTEAYGNVYSKNGVSQWSFGPGFISFEGSDPIDETTLLTTISTATARGKNSFEVADPSKLKVGDWVRLVESDPKRGTENAGSLLSSMIGNLLSTGQELVGEPQVVRFQSRIQAIEGNLVTLERALPYDIRLDWMPELHQYQPSVSNVGMERLTIQFPLVRYPGHFLEAGFNAVFMTNVSQCWMKDVEILNSDIGVTLQNTSFCTLDRITMGTTGDRSSDRWDWSGHHGIVISRGTDNLVNHFQINTRFAHDITVAWYALHTVFANGSGVDLNLDHHREFNYSSLFTNLDLGKGTRAFLSGGADQRGPHAGAFSTYWNLTSSKPIDQPVEGFGAMLNFVDVPFRKAPKNNNSLQWISATTDQAIPDLYQYQKEQRFKVAPSTLDLVR